RVEGLRAVARPRLPSFARLLPRAGDQIPHRFPLHPVVPAYIQIVDILAPSRRLWNNVQWKILAQRCRSLILDGIVGVSENDLALPREIPIDENSRRVRVRVRAHQSDGAVIR